MMVAWTPSLVLLGHDRHKRRRRYVPPIFPIPVLVLQHPASVAHERHIVMCRLRGASAALAMASISHSVTGTPITPVAVPPTPATWDRTAITATVTPAGMRKRNAVPAVLVTGTGAAA
jgi:hypothetical protein